MQCEVTCFSKSIFFSIILSCVSLLMQCGSCLLLEVCTVQHTDHRRVARHSHLGEARAVTVAFSQALSSNKVLKYQEDWYLPIKENCSAFTLVNITSFW